MKRKMNKIIGLLLLAALAGCQSNPTSHSSKFKTIMLKSYGEIETLPNMATFYIDLNCLGQTVKSSKECLVKKSNELNEKLLSFGIDKKDILTTSVSMNKSYTWRNNSSVFEGYKSSTETYITVRNLDKLDEIYTELLENRNLELGGLSYSHSNMDSLENEAYLDALKKADGLADRLLSRLPEKKKEILKVGNIELSASVPESNQFKYRNLEVLANANVQEQRSIAISQGTVKVNATLFAEYRIK
jgi:uncharacterized protein YggE